jgi:hypothetical protein
MPIVGSGGLYAIASRLKKFPKLIRMAVCAVISCRALEAKGASDGKGTDLL